MPPGSPSGYKGLQLSDSESGPRHAGSWIGHLLVLGSRVNHWSRTNPGRQAVVTLSVPTRDFAAALTGCGWLMAARPAALLAVPDAVGNLKVGASVRMLTPTKIVVGQFKGVDYAKDRLNISGDRWVLSSVRAICQLDSDTEYRRQTIPIAGPISRSAGTHIWWERNLCTPSASVAIVGTSTWLKSEMDSYIWNRHGGEQISNLLRPFSRRAATWSTQIYSTAHLNQNDTAPDGTDLTILDGASAAMYLPAIYSRAIVVILDKNIADQTAGERILQYRNTRGQPLSARDDLSWPTPSGIQALFFSVAL